MPGTTDGAALPPLEIASRLGRLREGLGEVADALLVTTLTNVRYLTGFTGSAGLLLVLPDDALFVTDGRYRDQAAAELAAAGAEVRIEVARGAAQLEALGDAAKGCGRIGLEAGSVSWALLDRLRAVLDRCELVPTSGLVEALRAVKDPGEVARIERAADLADVALAQVKPLLAEGPTEAEVALALEAEMRRRGADGVAFETIVASGARSALPHARAGRHRIEPGELVVVDFGALVDGYRSDMTRTLCVGTPREAALVDLLDAVLAAQRAGLRAVRPGATGGDVDAACRDALEAAGYGEAFLHGTGHGVGLDIHEAPVLGPGATDILVPGSVVTVEPGAYLAGTGGARIEDTVVVTESGARPLTKSTKDCTL